MHTAWAYGRRLGLWPVRRTTFALTLEALMQVNWYIRGSCND